MSSVRVSEGLKKSVEKERLFLSDVNLCQSGEEASRRGVVEREQDEAEAERATDRTVEVTRRTCWRRERLPGSLRSGPIFVDSSVFASASESNLTLLFTRRRRRSRVTA